MAETKTIPFSAIRSEGLQVRAETDRGHVDDLAELFGDDGVWPESLPPCIVFFDGATYWLADGHHRYQAAQEAGCTEIPCDVRQGDRTAALWCAIGANSAHGLKRSNDDKRRAVLLAYELDNTLSDREIARRTNVSHGLANYVLRDARGQSSPLSKLDSAGTPFDPAPDHAPANRDRLSPSAIPAPDIRKDARGRKMDVSRIGKSTPAAPASAAAEAPRRLDSAGLPIGPQSDAAFDALAIYAEIEGHLTAAAKLFNELSKLPGGEMLRHEYLKKTYDTRDGVQVERFYSIDLKNVRNAVKWYRPFASVCPYCGDNPSEGCKGCRGLPYVIESVWNSSPEKRRDAVAARAEPAEAVA